MKLKIKWTGNKIKCLWLKSSMIKLWWAKLRMINEEIIKSLGAEKKPLSSIEFLTFLNSEYLNHSEWLKAFFHLFVLMQIFIPKKNPWIWIAIISPVFLERWLIGSRLFHPPCRLLEMPLWMTSESDRTCHAGDRCWNTPQRHFWFQPLICFLDLFALRWFWFWITHDWARSKKAFHFPLIQKSLIRNSLTKKSSGQKLLVQLSLCFRKAHVPKEPRSKKSLWSERAQVSLKPNSKKKAYG